MNVVGLVGRITKDIELRHTQSGIPVVQFYIAINNGKDKDGNSRQADFPMIRVWEKQAENLAKYCKKGSLISIQGSLKTNNYTLEDGTKKYETYVLARNIQFLNSEKVGSSIPEPPYDVNHTSTQPVATQVTQTDPFAEFGEEMKNLEFPFDANIEVDPEHRPW